jgi:hypothetical protein
VVRRGAVQYFAERCDDVVRRGGAVWCGTVQCSVAKSSTGSVQRGAVVRCGAVQIITSPVLRGITNQWFFGTIEIARSVVFGCVSSVSFPSPVFISIITIIIVVVVAVVAVVVITATIATIAAIATVATTIAN